MKYLGALAILLAVNFAHAAPAPASPASAAAPKPPKPAGHLGTQHDTSQPIQVNSDTFFADMNADTGTYHGNVIVVQGDMKMHADAVKVIAPDGKAQRMEASGHVVVEGPQGTATGDAGVYEVAARIIHLTGHVVLTKNQSVMHGTALDVNMDTGEAHLVALNDQGKPGRVQAVFIPPPKAAPTAPKPPGAGTPSPSASPQPAPAQTPATQSNH